MTTMRKKIQHIVFISSLSLLLASTALAANNSTAPTKTVPINSPIIANSIPALVRSIVTTILGIVGAIALAMFVYGGVMWMTSAGNQNRVEKGKETLIWATFGLIVIFGSYALLKVVFDALT